MIRRIVNRIVFPNTCDNEHFISYLRKNGAEIGIGTRFIDPKKCSVDPGRLDYICIGENCCISVGAIIAHDYSWYVLRDAYHDILPDPGGKIIIGNNCFIGYQACILKGTTIGDNVIIGARAVVKGYVPSNTVWAGSPAHQLYTLDDLYQRKLKNRLSDAIFRRDHIRNKYKRNPTVEDMGFFAFLFLERTEGNYEKFISRLEFNGIQGDPITKSLFFSQKPYFSSYEQFLEYNLS